MFKALTLWRQQRQAVRELSGLSDRELADIGIVRGQIEAIVRGVPQMSRDEVEAVVKPRGSLSHLGQSPAFGGAGRQLPARA